MGRGNRTEIHDTKLSRQQIGLRLTNEDKIIAKCVGTNISVLIRSDLSAEMPKNSEQQLKSGDILSLLPGMYSYKVEILNNKESQPDLDTTQLIEPHTPPKHPKRKITEEESPCVDNKKTKNDQISTPETPTKATLTETPAPLKRELSTSQQLRNEELVRVTVSKFTHSMLLIDLDCSKKMFLIYVKFSLKSQKKKY